MANSALAKKRPLHRKKKASATKVTGSHHSGVKKVKITGCIDVTDKAHIVIIDGNVDQQDAALLSLRKELAQMNEKAAIVINAQDGDKSKAQKKQFSMRWKFIP